jgi:hypothetical protein
MGRINLRSADYESPDDKKSTTLNLLDLVISGARYVLQKMDTEIPGTYGARDVFTNGQWRGQIILNVSVPANHATDTDINDVLRAFYTWDSPGRADDDGSRLGRLIYELNDTPDYFKVLYTNDGGDSFATRNFYFTFASINLHETADGAQLYHEGTITLNLFNPR